MMIQQLVPVLLPMIATLGFIRGLIGPDIDDTFAVRLIDKLLLDYSLVFALTGAAVLFRRIERAAGSDVDHDVGAFIDHAESDKATWMEGPGFWGY